MSRPLSISAAAALWLSLAGAAPAAEDALPIIEKAFEAAKANEERVRQYVYRERLEERRFDRKGAVKKRQSRTWDVTLLESSEYRRLVARDDRPLDARSEAREQKKLDRQIRKMMRETPSQTAQRRARVEREREEGETFLAEITRAFDFRLVGEEEVDGLPAWVISAEPRPGYQPPDRRARALTRVRATLWVARDDYGWVQADIETFDDLTWAAIYRLRSGSRIHFEQRRLDDGVWVTESWRARLRARIALVYRLEAELIGTYNDFRRFTTDTTVTGWSRAD